MMFESDHGISFQSDRNIPEFPVPSKVAEWLLATANTEGRSIESLSYSFVTDDELLELNRQFLDHDTYTDILTFPYNYDPIESDICISIDRTRENAKTHDSTERMELLRVVVHGLLHMCGYGDGTEEEKLAMRGKEDHYLAAWSKLI